MPLEERDRDSAQSALDELFQCARRYTGSKEFEDLMRFPSGTVYRVSGRTRRSGERDGKRLLAHIQMPGCPPTSRKKQDAPAWDRDSAHRWVSVRPPGTMIAGFGPDARPIVLLQPGGPVMFAFDVSDTRPLPGAKPLPRHVTDPFATSGPGWVGDQLERTVENAKRDGVGIDERDAGSQSAGQISAVESDAFVRFQFRTLPKPESRYVKVRYELLLNAKHSPEAQYATLAHELAHLYCGHLGTPNLDWWPSRCGLSEKEREFEAESVAFLVCSRLGIENPSPEYLSGYLENHISIPAISLNCVLKSAGSSSRWGSARSGYAKKSYAKRKNGPSQMQTPRNLRILRKHPPVLRDAVPAVCPVVRGEGEVERPSARLPHRSRLRIPPGPRRAGDLQLHTPDEPRRHHGAHAGGWSAGSDPARLGAAALAWSQEAEERGSPTRDRSDAATHEEDPAVRQAEAMGAAAPHARLPVAELRSLPRPLVRSGA